MSIMTGAATRTVQLPLSGDWTVDDLDALPDDGLRHELIDGILVVTPGPVWAHQGVLGSLFTHLRQACPRDRRVLLAPFDWRPHHRTSLEPDILVARYPDLAAVPQGKNLVAAPLLAVEIASPSTRRYDRTAKLSVYQEAGVASYWLVEPDPEVPSLTVLELDGGRYVERALITGDQSWTGEQPFPITLRPSDLVVDLHP